MRPQGAGGDGGGGAGDRLRLMGPVNRDQVVGERSLAVGGRDHEVGAAGGRAPFGAGFLRHRRRGGCAVAGGPRRVRPTNGGERRGVQGLLGGSIWGEVEGALADLAPRLAGGQRQRLWIDRALATDPELLLFDEPTSSLDPIATCAIEELVHELKKRVTILIVTHNMQQAARVSDYTAYMLSLIHISEPTRPY